MQPRVTIITPNFNGAKYLHDALMSVNAQQVKAIHRVQDAYSTDSSADLVCSFNKAMNSDVRIVQRMDTGISQALNYAVEEIETDYFGWLNSDEFYLEGAIERIIEIFDNSDADIVFGDCVFVDANGRALRLVPGHTFSSFVLKRFGCFISSCTVFIRTESFRGNLFDVACFRAMDWDMWLRLSKKLKFQYEPMILGAFRVHPLQITAAPEINNLEEFEYLKDKHNFRSNPLDWRYLRSGSLAHALLKITSGSYYRQLLFASRSKQKTMIWWKN